MGFEAFSHMGSVGGMDVCELMGIYLLAGLNNIAWNNIGPIEIDTFLNKKGWSVDDIRKKVDQFL